jgi:peptidyl-prolyl cis-trans isomerase D
MLDFIRKKKESVVVKAVFVFIVLSFIGTIFLVWGKGSDGMGGSGGYAAKVNGKKISYDDYRNAYENIRNSYMQLYGQAMPPELEKVLGLKKVALDNLIDRILILSEAKKMGIKVSKDEVTAAIAAMPFFQKDGVFNFELYQKALNSQRIPAKDFEESQFSDLTVKKARNSIIEKVSVSDDEALAQYRKENDKIELEFAAFGPADVIGEIKPTEAELNDYLQKNQNEFKTSEKVAISYIVLDPASQNSKVSLTEDEIQSFYQKNIDRWQGNNGILPLAEVRDKVKTEAIKQKAAKQAYELAADTLFKNIKSGDIKLIASQLNLKVNDTGMFPANAAPQPLTGETAVIKKALELKAGELGGPVETTRGIYVIKTRERAESVVPPLKDIRAEVEQKVKNLKAADLAKTKAEEAAKAFVAKTAVKSQSSASFGYSAKGDVPGIGNSPELMEAAFKLTAASPASSIVYKAGNRWFAIKLKSRTESPRAEFDKNKEQLKQKMLPKKQEEALTTWIKGLREKAKIEINPSLLAEK